MQENYSLLHKVYFLSVYLLVSIIIALIVIQIPVGQQIKEAKIKKQELIESYGELQQSSYWWESSNVWWFKARAQLSSCPDYFTLNTLQSSFALACIPQSVPQIQKFPGIKLLSIDATFADDSIDFIDAREYFYNQGAKLYLTQSPGRFPGSWVIRASSKFIFNDKKVLYVFYNERKKIEKYKRDQIIHEIGKHFPDLDEVRLHSFFYYDKVMSEEPFSSDLWKLMYYVGDCELPEHKFCNTQLVSDGKYQSFTHNLIVSDLDFFFIVPAHWNDTNILFEKNSRPNTFLQWLFKSND